MHKIPMTIDAFLFITGSSVNHRPVGQHRPSFIGNVKNITMAFLALVVLKGSVCLLTLQFMVVFRHILGEMNKDIFYPMGRF